MISLFPFRQFQLIDQGNGIVLGQLRVENLLALTSIWPGKRITRPRIARQKDATIETARVQRICYTIINAHGDDFAIAVLAMAQCQVQRRASIIDDSVSVA